MSVSITSLTHHSEAAGDMLNRLRLAGVLDRRITVQLTTERTGRDVRQCLADRAIQPVVTKIQVTCLAFLALALAVTLVHGIHAHWVGPAVVGLTVVMLGCAAWIGLDQAADERRRERCAAMVEEDGVLITVHEVDGADAGSIERLLHDSGGEAVSQGAGR